MLGCQLTFLEDFAACTLLARMHPCLTTSEAAFLRVIAAIVSKQPRSFLSLDTFARRKRSIQLVTIIIDMDLAVQNATQRHPDILIAESPRVKVENGVFRIPRDFLQQLKRSFSL
jgi:hypothetical protein